MNHQRMFVRCRKDGKQHDFLSSWYQRDNREESAEILNRLARQIKAAGLHQYVVRRRITPMKGHL